MNEVKTMKINHGKFKFMVGTKTKSGHWKMELARNIDEVNRWVQRFR